MKFQRDVLVVAAAYDAPAIRAKSDAGGDCFVSSTVISVMAPWLWLRQALQGGLAQRMKKHRSPHPQLYDVWSVVEVPHARLTLAYAEKSMKKVSHSMSKIKRCSPRHSTFA